MPYVNWQCDIADCRQNAVSLFSRCDGGQETWAQFKPWRRGEEISRDVWGLLPRRVRRRDARGRQRCRVDAEQFISIFSRCRAGQSPAPTATLTEMYDPVGTKTRIDCMSSHFRGRDFCPPREGGVVRSRDSPPEFYSEDLCPGFELGWMPARICNPAVWLLVAQSQSHCPELIGLCCCMHGEPLYIVIYVFQHNFVNSELSNDETAYCGPVNC